MAKALFTNNASGTLASAITTTGATSLVLTGGQGALFPSPSAGNYFYATIIDASNNKEIVQVTANAADTFTMVRAQDGTTARTFAIGSKVELRPCAAAFNEKVATGDLGTGVATLLSGTATGTGGPVGSANPTFSGTVGVGSGSNNVQFGDSSNYVKRGEFLSTDFGYRTSFAINEIRTSWPSFTGVTNDSDERLKIQLGDQIDYWDAAKTVATLNLISDFQVFPTPEKEGQGVGGFGVKSAQQMFQVFGGLGVHQPDEPHTQEELDAYAADQLLPEAERTVTLRTVHPYWSANCETWGLIALKIASRAATEIDILKSQVSALEARLSALEAK